MIQMRCDRSSDRPFGSTTSCDQRTERPELIVSEKSRAVAGKVVQSTSSEANVTELVGGNCNCAKGGRTNCRRRPPMTLIGYECESQVRELDGIGKSDGERQQGTLRSTSAKVAFENKLANGPC